MKKTAIFIIGIAVLVGGGILLFGNAGNSGTSSATGSRDNVVLADGKQVITIDTKGGYSPRLTLAQANIPTVLKMKTASTFDCSAALVIPSIGYRKNLPASGETLIEIPPQKAGSTLRGVCAMGMYSFEVSFS